VKNKSQYIFNVNFDLLNLTIILKEFVDIINVHLNYLF